MHYGERIAGSGEWMQGFQFVGCHRNADERQWWLQLQSWSIKSKGSGGTWNVKW